MVLDLLALSHDAMNWLSHLPMAGKLSCLHTKMSGVATSALGRGMDSSLAAKLAHSQAPSAGTADISGSCQGAPSVWGPAMWKSLHCMVHNMPQTLPPDQQRSFQDMMDSLPSVLPCSNCGDHLRQHLHDDPPTPYLATRDDLERWLVRLHNTVNLETGKAPVPEAEAMANINKMCGCSEAPTQAAPAAATMASMEPWTAALWRPCWGPRAKAAVVPRSWQDFM